MAESGMVQDKRNRIVESRIYNVSGCDRLITYTEGEWFVVDTIAGWFGIGPQEVLQMAASHFPDDAFEKHETRANDEIMNRVLHWGEGLLGQPVNYFPDPVIAPRP